MKAGEQYSRCKAARRVVGCVDGKKTIMCKVYGRTVANCRDCAFSILQRPAYLERIEEERQAGEET